MTPIQPAQALPRLVSVATDLEAKGRHAEATAAWEQIHTLDPTDRAARLHVARAAVASENPQHALRILQGGTSGDPQEFDLWIEALLAAGDVEAAREALLERAGQYPDARDALTPLANRAFGEAADVWAAWADPVGPVAGGGRTPFPGDLAAAHLDALVTVEPIIDFLDEEPLLAIVSPLDEAEPLELSPPILSVLEFTETIVEIAIDPADARDLVDADPWTVAEPASVSDANSDLDSDSEVFEVELDLTGALDRVAAGDDATEWGFGPEAGSFGREGQALLAGVPIEATKPGAAGEGSDLLALGRTYLAAGLHEQAVDALQRAAQGRESRYDAALALAELHEWRAEGSRVAEWLEQAAESAPSPVKRGVVLYRLGLVLEQLGRPGRALTVLRELEAMAPDFRDVRARIARLEATPPGGGPSLR